MSKDEWFSAGRVGGEALGDRGEEARLVDDGEVAGLVTFNDFYFYFLNDGLVTFNHFYALFIAILLAWLSSITYSSRSKLSSSPRSVQQAWCV